MSAAPCYGGRVTGPFPNDIYTEPADVDPDTMRNLGPLTPLAGIWEGRKGLNLHKVGEHIPNWLMRPGGKA